jgi:outer membrane lipopolysaccharide assembly protein LptE/RlpB
MKRIPALSLVALTLLTAACGYALAGRGNALPDHIKRIGVPNFTNHSETPDLDRILSEAVRQELQGKGRYVVVQDSAGVDALLSGTVEPVTLSVAALTDNRQAQRYLITVRASVEFKDTVDNKVLWANPSMRVSDDYEATASTTISDPATVFNQDTNALNRLAKAFARTLVTSILEAF